MCVELIRETNQKARKIYSCDASSWLRESGILCENVLTFAEYREVVKAKRNGWMIQKGEIYNRQFNKCDGEVYYFISIPAILAICLKYDVFGDY